MQHKVNWMLLIGVAYLLRILGLNNEFDSLKWFQSVSENYEEKLNVLKTQEINALKDDAKLQQPLSLSYTRLQVYYKVKYKYLLFYLKQILSSLLFSGVHAIIL